MWHPCLYASSRTVISTALVVLLQLAAAAPAPTADDAAQASADNRDENRYSVTVKPLLPNGRPAHRSYLTLWRALEPGEKAPVNTVNGPQGFGYYDPVIWDDQQSGARWIRERSAEPHNAKRVWKEDLVRFTDLPAGRYQVSVVSYRFKDGRPDPTPYGVTAPFTLGRGGEAPHDDQPITVDVTMGGTAPLVLRVLDAQSQQPVAGLAVRLRDAGGMPIVHGTGSGNYFEGTSEDGEVYYDHLQPGKYTVQVLGKLARVNHFVQYEPMRQWTPIQVDGEGPTRIDILVPPRKLDAVEIERRFPFYVFGRVTDEVGKPLGDVEVHAATGHGTLARGGTTYTNSDGRYRLYFGPGMMLMSDTAPRGVGVQAALISARKKGWYETHLNQQGGLAMSDQTPEAIAEDIKKRGRRRMSIEQIVFPGVPREVNFMLAEAAVLKGKFVSNGPPYLKGESLYLTGDELPPGCGVLRYVTIGDRGEFQMDSVPLGKRWRFGMRVGGTFKDIETEPFTLDAPGAHLCEVSLDARQSADGAVTLRLSYRPLAEASTDR